MWDGSSNSSVDLSKAKGLDFEKIENFLRDHKGAAKDILKGTDLLSEDGTVDFKKLKQAKQDLDDLIQTDRDHSGHLTFTDTSDYQYLKNAAAKIRSRYNPIVKNLISHPMTSERPVEFEKVEVKGDPNLGTVIHIRQFHITDQIDLPSVLVIGEYQFEILKKLIENEAVHVFAESLTVDLGPNAKLTDWKKYKTLIRELFPEGEIPEKPNFLQKLILARFGAGSVYYFLFDDVHLHKTWTPEQARNFYAFNDYNMENSWTKYDVIHGREQLAMWQVMPFLRDNPGETAYLIYGAAHEFKDNVTNYGYKLNSLSFPKMKWKATKLFRRLKKDDVRKIGHEEMYRFAKFYSLLTEGLEGEPDASLVENLYHYFSSPPGRVIFNLKK